MEGGEPVEKKPKDSVWPGLALALALTALAFGLGWGLSKSGSTAARLLDPVLVSMLLGLAWGNLLGRESLLPGISLAVRRLLPLGIILLGARMDFLEALRIGLPGLGLSAFIVVLAMALLFWMGRKLGLDRDFACLLGVGTGICGGTAIVAVAPLLKAEDRDVIVGVGLVTLIGLVAMLILPVVAGLLGFSQTQYGLVAGLTIHQTPQVIASGFAFGETAGQVATVAKLARVCLLAPMTVAIGWWVAHRKEEMVFSWEAGMIPARKDPEGEHRVRRPWYRLLPAFAIGFLLLAAARTLGLLPTVEMTWNLPGTIGEKVTSFDTVAVLKTCSSYLLAMGMVGVGFQTRLSQGREIGWRPVVAASASASIIGVVVLVIVKLFFP
jgi:uncharacterized integral membrane protein (TIGR00698 family)